MPLISAAGCAGVHPVVSGLNQNLSKVRLSRYGPGQSLLKLPIGRDLGELEEGGVRILRGSPRF